MSGGTARNITINVTDEGRLLALRTVLGYESGRRGLTVGQAFEELLREAVDTDGYPDEVRAELDEIDASRRDRAARRSLEVVRAS